MQKKIFAQKLSYFKDLLTFAPFGETGQRSLANDVSA